MPYLPPHIKRQSTTVRITEECRRELSRRRKGDEPLGNVVMRAILELGEEQKKVQGLLNDIEDLNDRLYLAENKQRLGEIAVQSHNKDGAS